ncbi:response regulator [Methylobacterium sp. PvR107]|uniref:response regulator n=1 Tax=Methylobacterium sp. PvR107 TaxID=2806597 RepID=UPI001AE93D8B|nr:response regulator [Methylobacterium sp. PvR107]MBP1181219.1 DNA-binding response OmpR family regulator [Methylobacterium sp. PvR107]
MSAGSLSRRRVPAVEDEYVIAEALEEALRQAGATVLGPVSSVDGALALLRSEAAPEAAILGVNLCGEMVYPVADCLIARGVPFVFATGYDQTVLPERYAAACRLEKPFAPPEILRARGRLLAGVAAPEPA